MLDLVQDGWASNAGPFSTPLDLRGVCCKGSLQDVGSFRRACGGLGHRADRKPASLMRPMEGDRSAHAFTHRVPNLRRVSRRRRVPCGTNAQTAGSSARDPAEVWEVPGRSLKQGALGTKMVSEAAPAAASCAVLRCCGQYASADSPTGRWRRSTPTQPNSPVVVFPAEPIPPTRTP